MAQICKNVYCIYFFKSAVVNPNQLKFPLVRSLGRIVILEDAFQGDDELKTNLVQLCKTKNVELWTA